MYVAHTSTTTLCTKQKDKQSFQAILRTTMVCIGNLGKTRLCALYPSLVGFLSKAKDVVKAANDWTKYQTVTRLKDLVDAVYQLKNIGDLEAMFRAVSNQEMDPSMRWNILNMVAKVARYREVARCLYRTSKKSGLLRSTKVIIVRLPTQPTHDRFWTRINRLSHQP